MSWSPLSKLKNTAAPRTTKPSVHVRVSDTMKPVVQKAPVVTAQTVEEELGQGGHISIVRVIDSMLAHATGMRASDIHIDPGQEQVQVRLRIDGVLQDAHMLPKNIHPEIISRIKILAGLRTDEHQAAQDGRFRTIVEDSPVDVRVSIIPTYYGENAVLRLLHDNAEEFTLDALGFSNTDQDKILRAIKRPYGMILATGPTGSGKTTTLYTLVKILNTIDVSIITVEDPVEYSITGINQIQVNPRTNLTFAQGLRSILRQDPNIIMVGEIRDSETAGIAVNTALTGHLLLSTLHTNDAATTLPRLLDMKIEPYIIASTVSIAIGQRLVRKICTQCKQKRVLTDVEKASFSSMLPADMDIKTMQFSEGNGCETCANSGYKGRIGIYEVLVIDKNIREALLSKASAATLRDIAIQQGMTPMLEDGFRKVHAGITTVEEVLRMLYE